MRSVSLRPPYVLEEELREGELCEEELCDEGLREEELREEGFLSVVGFPEGLALMDCVICEQVRLRRV